MNRTPHEFTVMAASEDSHQLLSIEHSCTKRIDSDSDWCSSVPCMVVNGSCSPMAPLALHPQTRGLAATLQQQKARGPIRASCRWTAGLETSASSQTGALPTRGKRVVGTGQITSIRTLVCKLGSHRLQAEWRPATIRSRDPQSKLGGG